MFREHFIPDNKIGVEDPITLPLINAAGHAPRREGLVLVNGRD